MNELISVEDLDLDDINGLFELADVFAEVQQRSVPKVPALRGRTVVMAFFEDSTRTRASFDLAARRLSADVATFAAGASSLSKGESLRDTVETITAMGVDAIVVRHPHPGVPQAISRYTTAAVINAGDGRHQHPTQALLDAYTLRSALGDLEGRRILLCGDILNSRVARSNIAMFSKLGARVVVCGPHTLLPPHTPGQMFGYPVEVVDDLDAIVPDIDVAYMLRIQRERIADAALPSIREYRSLYGLTDERARRLPADAVVMHPGPMNRGVEIDPDVADSDRSLISLQVTNGVGIRMAVLYQILGPGQFDRAIELDLADETAGDGAEPHPDGDASAPGQPADLHEDVIR